MQTLIRLILGFATFACGIYGFYAIHEASKVVEKNPLFGLFMVFASIAMAGTGIFLLTDQELKEKDQTKPGEQQ